MTCIMSIYKVLGIGGLPSVDEFLTSERPDWQRIMKLVTQVFSHFTQNENKNISAPAH